MMAADEIFVLVLVLVCAGIVAAMNIHSRRAHKARVQAEGSDVGLARDGSPDVRTP
jgi:hypothetical protein